MSKDKKRKIILVIEDVDIEKDTFSFTMQGDVDRMGSKEQIIPTAAEHWGSEFFKLCTDHLQGSAKKLNRQDRRKG